MLGVQTRPRLSNRSSPVPTATLADPQQTVAERGTAAAPRAAAPARIAATPRIVYDRSEAVWDGFEDYLEGLIEDYGAKRVLDIGGGARPTLPLDTIHWRDLECTVLDISPEELAKAPDGYQTVAADIASPKFEAEGQYDLAFSKMLAEHVRDGRQFHRNVLDLLAPGGLAVHFFPTMYAPPFVVNRLIPEGLSSRMLDVLAPRDKVRASKFPAYYQWCRGPSGRQIRRFEELGYEVVEYAGFYGHAGYYKKLGPLAALHERTVKRLLKNPKPSLTSYARVTLRKPGGSAAKSAPAEPAVAAGTR